jgi:hypothetical protein
MYGPRLRYSIYFALPFPLRSLMSISGEKWGSLTPLGRCCRKLMWSLFAEYVQRLRQSESQDILRRTRQNDSALVLTIELSVSP